MDCRSAKQCSARNLAPIAVPKHCLQAVWRHIAGPVDEVTSSERSLPIAIGAAPAEASATAVEVGTMVAEDVGVERPARPPPSPLPSPCSMDHGGDNKRSRGRG